MRRELITTTSPTLERDMSVIAYGHAGLPVLVFPSSEGKAGDYENFGMVEAVAPLIHAGKLRLYCVDSYDSQSWYGKHRPQHERAWRHGLFEQWMIRTVVPAIRRELGDTAARLTATGCSFGAFHSALFTLKHPDMFRHALCMSGVYDIRFLLDGHHDDWVYFNNPIEFVPNLHGTDAQALRRGVYLSLVCGQGNYEERCLASTRELWWQLRAKQIPNYMDLWGFDVAHDWPWWRTQIAWYMKFLVEGRHPWQNSSPA